MARLPAVNIFPLTGSIWSSAISERTYRASLSNTDHWAIFLLIFLESTGVPLPGETTLVAASVFSATTHGLDIGLIITAAAAAAILGDNLGYWIGHHYGMRFLRRYGHYVRLSEDRLKIGKWLFRKYGGRVVFFGRFTAFLRTYAALMAGAMNFPARQFFFWNASGGIVWAAIFGLGGYLFGQAINLIAGPISTVLFVAVVAGIVGRRGCSSVTKRTCLRKPKPL